MLGIPIGGTGDEDDDWFFTYFQPYRYIINRIPVYPSIGNHDADETEERDDRAQVEDNFYLRERILGEEAAGRASFCPGLVLPVPLRIRHRVRLHRHVEGGFLQGPPACSSIPSTGNSSSRHFPPTASASIWRIPFAHHPPYSAGPQHHNTRGHGAAGAAVRARRREGDVQRARAQFPALARRRDRLLRDRRGGEAAAHAARPLRGGAHGVVGDRMSFPAGAHRRRSDDRPGHRRRSSTRTIVQSDITRLDPDGKPLIGLSRSGRRSVL